MLGTVTGVIAFIVAIFLMKYSKSFQPGGAIHFILERLAAVAFVTAGSLGIGGWLGDLTNTIVTILIGFFTSASNIVVGQSVFGIIICGIAIYWFLAWLPSRFSKANMNDALIYGGFFIPLLLAAASIPLAGPLLALFEGIGQFGVGLMGS